MTGKEEKVHFDAFVLDFNGILQTNNHSSINLHNNLQIIIMNAIYKVYSKYKVLQFPTEINQAVPLYLSICLSVCLTV